MVSIGYGVCWCVVVGVVVVVVVVCVLVLSVGSMSMHTHTPTLVCFLATALLHPEEARAAETEAENKKKRISSQKNEEADDEEAAATAAAAGGAATGAAGEMGQSPSMGGSARRRVSIAGKGVASGVEGCVVSNWFGVRVGLLPEGAQKSVEQNALPRWQPLSVNFILTSRPNHNPLQTTDQERHYSGHFDERGHES